MPETTEIDTYEHEDCISSRVLRSSPPPRRCLSSTLTPKGLTGLRQGHVSVAASRGLHVIHGDVAALPRGVRDYVEEKARVCAPDHVHVCDGSERENQLLMYVLQKDGILQPLPKMDNCWLARTDPADVARVESLTFISTDDKRDTIPEPKNGAKGQLGHWMAPADLDTELDKRFPGCMTGRTMFVIPFSMGPVGSPLAKIGVQLTDSAYVAASMRIMTRMGDQALQALGDQDFVKCLHSVGRPLPLTEPLNNSWPCAPSKVIVAHKPKDNEICSFGSGYGGNSLLGKKCFALRLGSIIGRREGWLAEHMLIMGIKNKKTGEKRYVAAAFPSACGKTNLAMMTPALEDYEITCVGDDIAWMKFDADGRLRAINPEAGFFGVAPGTSDKTNPMAMASIQANTVFTNVAATSDGGVYWDGLEDELKASGASVESWLGAPWTPESPKPAAHPNSRFCTPASQCPIMDEAWEAPEGVPIDAIIFGGRRPQGVPLVYEARSWQHGVFVGAAMRSEATAAAEHKAKVIMHDPFAMRPFFGYNFGDYLQHWLSLGKQDGVQLPKIFHVNWFRKSDQGGFLWPGFGENSRVLDWIVRRCAGEDIAKSSAIGLVPKEGSINLEGLKEDVDMDALFSLPKDFWEAECDAIQTYFDDQVNDDLPPAVMAELRGLRSRVRDEL